MLSFFKKKLVLFILIFQMFSAYSNEPKQEYSLLITGCGRCGTEYISKLLTTAGLKIVHEHFTKTNTEEGIASWFLAVDETKALTIPSLNNIVFKHTFHQVRHPLDVISSWYNNKYTHVWDYIYNHIPEISSNESLLVRCAKYWYYWNLKAEEKAEWTYRIEDIDYLLDDFEKRLGLITPLDRDALYRVSRKTNTKLPITKKITWTDLKEALSEEDFFNITSLANKYGYSTEDP